MKNRDHRNRRFIDIRTVDISEGEKTPVRSKGERRSHASDGGVPSEQTEKKRLVLFGGCKGRENIRVSFRFLDFPYYI